MKFILFCDIAKNIKKSSNYYIMADVEQLIFCLR